jgi:hypothetical protein
MLLTAGGFQLTKGADAVYHNWKIHAHKDWSDLKIQDSDAV